MAADKNRIKSLLDGFVHNSFKKIGSTAYKIMDKNETYLVEVHLRQVGRDNEIEASIYPKYILLNEFSNFILNFSLLSGDEVLKYIKSGRFNTKMSFHLNDFHAFPFYSLVQTIRIDARTDIDFISNCVSAARGIFEDSPSLENTMLQILSDDMPIDMKIGFLLYLKMFDRARLCVEEQRFGGEIFSLFPRNADLFLRHLGY